MLWTCIYKVNHANNIFYLFYFNYWQKNICYKYHHSVVQYIHIGVHMSRRKYTCFNPMLLTKFFIEVYLMQLLFKKKGISAASGWTMLVYSGGLDLRNRGNPHLSSCPSSAEAVTKAKTTVLNHSSYRHHHFDQKQNTGKVEKHHSSFCLMASWTRPLCDLIIIQVSFITARMTSYAHG